MSRLQHNPLVLVFTLWLVLINCKLTLADRGDQDGSSTTVTTPPEFGLAIDDIENWIQNSTAETIDELINEGPPLDAGDAGNIGRAIGREGETGGTALPLPPPLAPPPKGPRGGRAGRDGVGVPEGRPEYFWTVTVPWTGGMLAFLCLFLYAMRTDGCVYRRLTQSYTPPAARQQLAEEERRERLEETERTATTAWESERARWRSQRSPHPDNSTDMVSSSSTEPAPSVSWAQSARSADERPATRRTHGYRQNTR